MPKTSGGVQCGHCGSKLSRVLETREFEVTIRGKRKTTIRRRRQCTHCGHRYWTMESQEEDLSWDPVIDSPDTNQTQDISPTPLPPKNPVDSTENHTPPDNPFLPNK